MSTLGSVTIPDDLIWSDEFSWSPVSQSQELTLGGALVLQESLQLKGRPITLKGSEDRAWMDKADVEALFALAATPGQTHTLTLPGPRAFTVAFNRKDGQPIRARQLMVGDDDVWVVEEIKLIEV
jgi:hypothetical protein